MGHVVVTWEGRVAPDRQADLIAAYQAGSASPPPTIVRHALLRDTADPDVWRAVSVWVSAEALDEYRQHAETPAALAMFRAAGAEPTRTISAIVESSDF
jgi:quinol monooxygenase YgiN